MHPVTESKDTFARLNAAATGNVLPFNATVAVNAVTVSPEKLLLAEWAERFYQATKAGRVLIADADGTFMEFAQLMKRTEGMCVGITFKIEE